MKYDEKIEYLRLKNDLLWKQNEESILQLGLR